MARQVRRNRTPPARQVGRASNDLEQCPMFQLIRPAPVPSDTSCRFVGVHDTGFLTQSLVWPQAKPLKCDHKIPSLARSAKLARGLRRWLRSGGSCRLAFMLWLTSQSIEARNMSGLRRISFHGKSTSVDRQFLRIITG